MHNKRPKVVVVPLGVKKRVLSQHLAEMGQTTHCLALKRCQIVATVVAVDPAEEGFCSFFQLKGAVSRDFLPLFFSLIEPIPDKQA